MKLQAAEEIKYAVEITSFCLAKFPVTKGLYYSITKKISVEDESNSIPIVNVSWLDAVRFCNLLSIEGGFNKCYSFDNESVFRGGSWACGERESGASCRKRSHPTFSIDDLGFRMAKSIF